MASRQVFVRLRARNRDVHLRSHNGDSFFHVCLWHAPRSLCLCLLLIWVGPACGEHGSTLHQPHWLEVHQVDVVLYSAVGQRCDSVRIRTDICTSQDDFVVQRSAHAKLCHRGTGQNLPSERHNSSTPAISTRCNKLRSYKPWLGRSLHRRKVITLLLYSADVDLCRHSALYGPRCLQLLQEVGKLTPFIWNAI